MSRFWEIVFCVPLLFRCLVCLSNLKQVPSGKLPLTSRKTVFSHLKILLFAFETIHGIAPDPTYIQNLVSLKSQGTYNLRWSGGILLASPTFRTKVTLGDRSFQIAAPKLWNAPLRELSDIPNLHTFKSNLKMYLFKFAYGWMNFNCDISII